MPRDKTVGRKVEYDIGGLQNTWTHKCLKDDDFSHNHSCSFSCFEIPCDVLLRVLVGGRRGGKSRFDSSRRYPNYVFVSNWKDGRKWERREYQIRVGTSVSLRQFRFSLVGTKEIVERVTEDSARTIFGFEKVTNCFTWKVERGKRVDWRKVGVVVRETSRFDLRDD